MHPPRAIKNLRRFSTEHELHIADFVWKQRKLFIRWPLRSLLLVDDCVRPGNRFHTYPASVIRSLRNIGIRVDSRSNGPAVMAYLLAGGERPSRNGNYAWTIHHIYDRRFPFPDRDTTVHAASTGSLFTEAAGLVAIHPVADSLASEVPYFAWLLRFEAFKRFRFDPDGVFTSDLNK